MAMDRQRNPLTTQVVEDKENVGSKPFKEDKNMKTIPQCMNKVCSKVSVNQSVGKSAMDLGKASTRPVLSTKSPISGRPIKPAKRMGLSTLQQSASNKSTVVGTARSKGLFQKESKPNNFEIYCEETEIKKQRGSETPKIVSASVSTQTDFDEWLSLEETKKTDKLAEEALHLLRSESSSEEYYKDIAEQRRLALEEALRENEELYDEVEKMKEKCAVLENALNEAESYKLMYLAMVEKAT